jgi:hypothetical protein
MAAGGEFGSLRHLAERFFGALDPRGPTATDEDWATGHLLPGERQLWGRMSGPDRRHAVGVARSAVALLGSDPAARDRAVVAAALLHDVGKVEARYGTFARVGITVAAMVAGRSRLVSWSARGAKASGWRRRVGAYLTHDVIGGDLLRAAGSDGVTADWARQHHLAASRWTVAPAVGAALKQADGD